jgi:5-methylcytosine-specific restriction endonuclease McrA
VSKGGTNDITNVQGLCRPCNSAKHTSTLDLRNKDGGSDGNGSGTGSA